MNVPEKYDGFGIIPDDEEGNEKVVFFELSDESKNGTPIEGSTLGDMYHIVIFKLNPENSDLEYNDSFEAIFIDPLYYAKRLLPHFYCTMIRKTDKSVKWFEEYLIEIMGRVMIKKLKKQKELLESTSK